MAVNKSSFPIIDESSIQPSKGIPEAARLRRVAEARGERSDALSRFILKWWRGDAHTHSKESTRDFFGYVEGVYDIEEAARYYRELGLEFVCFAEHASKPGSPEKQPADGAISRSLLEEAKRVTEFNRKEGRGGVAVLSGVETNIFFDEEGRPTLDLPPEVLRKLDFVIASRHSIANEKDPCAIRESLLFAVRNPCVDVIGHPDRNARVVGDWDMLRAHCPEAEAFHRRIQEKQREKAVASSDEERDRIESELQAMYSTVRKAIGKDPLGPGGEEDQQSARFAQELAQFIQAREKLEEEYWLMWEEIVQEMAAEGKAFEINLNDPPQERLLKMVARAKVPLFINYDAHDFHQYIKELQKSEGRKAADAWAKGEVSEDDLAVLEQYKLERMQSGPGVVAILRLVRTIRQLESLGLTPERVVNSSLERLLRFLTEERGKRTENLTQLTSP